MQAWVARLHRVEDAALVILLSAMIALAATQILMRNFFESGFVWIDPLLRVLVMWLSLLGATVATRDNKHIRIDLLNKLFTPNTHCLIQAVVGQISAWTCLVIGWYGMGWISLDFEDGMTAFAGIPAWMLEIIVPLSFTLIGLRYFILSLGWARSFVRNLHSADDTGA